MGMVFSWLESRLFMIRAPGKALDFDEGYILMGAVYFISFAMHGILIPPNQLRYFGLSFVVYVAASLCVHDVHYVVTV